ncbi:hypothetical protein pb186bvf_006405 [Paramecium bursaria]
MNFVNCRFKHQSELQQIAISGVMIEAKQLRDIICHLNKIKDQIMLSIDGKVIGLSGKVRQNQIVDVIRTNDNDLCLSCFSNKYIYYTPCCSSQICQVCDDEFKKFGLCFFIKSQKCQLSYINFVRQQEIPVKWEKPQKEFTFETDFANSQFFIMNSNNPFNHKLAKFHNCWATTEYSTKKLEFGKQLGQVILFFICPKLNQFLGVAKILNLDCNLQINWQVSNRIQLGKTFSIEWISQETIDLNDCEIINPLTNHSIIFSKDCQQLPNDESKLLLQKFVTLQKQIIKSESIDYDFDKIFNFTQSDQQNQVHKEEERKENIKQDTLVSKNQMLNLIDKYLSSRKIAGLSKFGSKRSDNANRSRSRQREKLHHY